MQALEDINVLEKNDEKGGRRITQSGQRDLDREYSQSFAGRCGCWLEDGRRLEKDEGIRKRRCDESCRCSIIVKTGRDC